MYLLYDFGRYWSAGFIMKPRPITLRKRRPVKKLAIFENGKSLIVIGQKCGCENNSE